MKKIHLFFAILVCSLILFGASAVEAATLTIQPTADQSIETFISPNCSDPNEGNGPLYVYDAYGWEARMLLKFDLSALPPGSIITSAQLSIYSIGSFSGSQSIGIAAHRLKQDWVEGNGWAWCSGTPDTLGGATWANASNGVPWITPGGYYDSATESLVTVSSRYTWYTWGITSLAQKWANGTAPNYGIILTPDVGSTYYKFFASAEKDANNNPNSIYRPKLVINYILPDQIPPTTAIQTAGTAGENNWFVSDVQVSLTANDNPNGSGVLRTEYSLNNINWNTYSSPFIVSAEGTNTIYYRSIDKAGNIETTKTQIIKIDKTTPQISGDKNTPPNENGWYKNDMTISFTANDAISGIASVSPDVILSEEGANQSATGTATDNAGNVATITINGINIDKTAPQITINSPQDGAIYTLNQSVLADFSANDTLSGIVSQDSTLPNGSPIDTAIPGQKSFSVAATDKAGNTIRQSIIYYVRYDFPGFLNPLNKDSYKKNSAIPVKFQLKDALGNYVANAVANLYLIDVNGQKTAATAKGSSNSGNLFRYDLVENQYIFNLDTKPMAAGNWQFSVELDDGSVKTISIILK